MTNSEIKVRLQPIRRITTLTRPVINDLIYVGDEHLVVRSERTGKERVIPYRHIRNEVAHANGCIADAFRAILGL